MKIIFSRPPAIGEVVIDEADSLHEGIDDRGADKSHPPFLEVFRESVALGRCARNVLHRLAAVHDRLVPYKIPKIPIKRSELFLNLDKGERIFARGKDFQPIPNNALIRKEFV